MTHRLIFILVLTYFVSLVQLTVNQGIAKDCGRIDIPPQAGVVAHRYEAASDMSIVHIRDVHCNYHVQQNIAAIIKLLVEDYGYTLITTEGAAGKIDTSLFQVVPDMTARESVCIDFMKTGYLSGVEYLSITHPDLPVTGYRGVEDASLYIENLSQFKSVIAAQESLKDCVAALLDSASAIARKAFPERLFDFEMKYLAYKRGANAIDEFITYACATADELNLDTGTYHQIRQYHDVIKFDINPALVSGELYRAVTQLCQSTETQSADTLRKAYIDYTLRRITDEELAYRIRPYFADAPQEYPAIYAFIEMITARQKLDYDALLKEVDSLAVSCRKAITGRYGGADDVKQAWCGLLDSLDAITVYEKLVSLDLSHEEYTNMIDKPHFLDDVLVSLSDLNKRFNATGTELINKGFLHILREGIDGANAFYRTADQRSCVMLTNLLSIMRNTGTHKAILLTGGFHSQAIELHLKNMEISHTVIKPHIQPVDEDIYTSCMMQCAVTSASDAGKTSSSATYLSFPVLFDTVLTKSDFFERIRASFARRLLTSKGVPLMRYYDALESVAERALLNDLLELGNLRLDPTIALGEMLHTLDLDSVMDYIMQYTDSVLRTEAELLPAKQILENDMINNQLFIAEYLISYLDYLITNTTQFPEVMSITCLATLYSNTRIPEMSIVHTLVKKRLEDKLHDAISQYIVFNQFASLPMDSSGDTFVFSQMVIWPVVSKKLALDDPDMGDLLTRVIESVNERLHTGYTTEWLLDVTINKSRPAVPGRFDGTSAVTKEAVTEWAYEEADMITAKYVEPVHLPFTPEKITDIKRQVQRAYGNLRSTVYAISHQYNIDLTDLISDICAMEWMFEEFDSYHGVSEQQILGFLHAMDMRFLRDESYLFYIKKAMELKCNSVFLVHRNFNNFDRQIIEDVLAEIDRVPDSILKQFPEFDHIFMFTALSAIGTAQERNIGIDVTVNRGQINNKVVVHEFIGHKLLFVLISAVLASGDFTRLESLVSPEDIITIVRSTHLGSDEPNDIRLISRNYTRYLLASLNGDTSLVQSCIDGFPAVFEEYNSTQPFRYRIRWNKTMIMNISIDFMRWTSEYHKDVFWLLVASGIYSDYQYSFPIHSSIFGHKVYDALFYYPNSVHLVSIVELIAYAAVNDQRPQYSDFSGSFVNFDRQTLYSIRHTLMKKLFGGWLWDKDKGWFYNRNPEEVIASLIQLKGPDNLVRLSIARNPYFKYLYPDFLQKMSDRLIPAIQDGNLQKMRDILDRHYLEGWRFNTRNWLNLSASDIIFALPAESVASNLSTDDLHVRQAIGDILLAAGIDEEPLLIEEIARVYDSLFEHAKPGPLATFGHDFGNSNALRNIMVSRHAEYFPLLIQLARKLDVRDPYLIPFLFSAQNLIMEYLDAKDQPIAQPVRRVKSYSLVGESL